ncbi:MAG TPA: AAA family ATPase, partial [Gammaproteobacteria bacterium]|nr:AAA family ATPase [Gammaproteobacteria bacterium]
VDANTGQVLERSFSLKRDIPRLHAALAQLPECRMVVIDPISAYLDGTESHANADVRGLLAPLAELAARRRVAVVAVTHLRKSEGKAIYRAVGSIAFTAAARSVLIVVRDQTHEPRRLILPAKNNLGPDTGGLAYSITTTSESVPHLLWDSELVTITADEALSATADDAHPEQDAAIDWLRDVLAEGPKATKDIESMAKDAGFAWATIRRAKDKLRIKPTKTRFDGGWAWALPLKMLAKMREGAHPTIGEHLRGENEQKPHRNAASSEDAHLSTFEGVHPSQDASEDAHPEHLRQNPHPNAIFEQKNSEDAHLPKVSTFDGGEHLGGTWTKPAFASIPNSPNARPWRTQYPPNCTTIDGGPWRMRI